MSVTPASLVAAYPEWVQVNTDYPSVVTTAIAQAVTRCDETVLGDRFDEAVMLACGEWLYDHPYGRDMRDSKDAASNPYEIQLNKIMTSKGSAWRTAWTTGDFE